MKKMVVWVGFCALVLAASVMAAEFKADVSIKTGDASLDMHLRNVNEKASTPAGAIEIKKDLKENLSLSDREISFLSRKGYTLAEINYMALIAKQSGTAINSVAALHSKGVGWGVLAKRYGVKPSALNKLRVRKMKQEKTVIREQAREEQKIKTHIPEPIKAKEPPKMGAPNMRPNIEKDFRPAPSGSGGGHGRGRGR